MVHSSYFLIVTAVVTFYAQETETRNVSLYKMFVNDEQVGFNSVLWVDRNLPVIIACRMTVANENLIMKKIMGSKTYKLDNTVHVRQSPYTFLNYTLTNYDKWSLLTTYRCVDKRKPYAPNYAQVTISFTLELPSTLADTLPPHIVSTHPPTLSSSRQRVTIPLTVAHTTEETHTHNPTIRGLNPLIYAVSVLILLGSLALVILLTCWIRVRRSYNRRHYRLTNNPQDYLDYISDNDLTPLASSELAASFEERPPSYSESQEMNSKTASSREGQNGGRIIGSVLRRSRILSSSVLRQNSSDRGNEGESSERANGRPSAIRIFLPRPTLTSPRTVATVRPSPPSSTSVLTSRSTSHNTTNEQDTEPCTATEGNMNGIGAQNRGSPQVLSLPQTTMSCTTSNVEGSSGVINNAPGCLSTELMSSGADAQDQNTRNGNGTHPPSSEPISQTESDREIPVGMLIDLT